MCRSPEPGRVSYRTRVDEPDQRLASIRARHVKMTRYFRAFALTASTADLMAMSLRFAEHYDRLATAGMLNEVELAGEAAPGRPKLRRGPPPCQASSGCTDLCLDSILSNIGSAFV